jgi:uncharacterized membrane protein
MAHVPGAGDARGRARLVDHFKDIHVVIAGIAITFACGQLFPFGLSSFVRPTFWMFLTFLITIIPILHGSSRSLDVKWLDSSARTVWDRGNYMWDVYVLLITAILFVAVAYALPSEKVLDDFRLAAPTNSYSPGAVFYWWLGAMFTFDTIALIVDWIKSHVRTRLRPSYAPWVLMNGALAIVCFTAGALIYHAKDTFSMTVPFVVFLFAFARTVADYALSDDFMFP